MNSRITFLLDVGSCPKSFDKRPDMNVLLVREGVLAALEVEKMSTPGLDLLRVLERRRDCDVRKVKHHLEKMLGDSTEYYGRFTWLRRQRHDTNKREVKM